MKARQVVAMWAIPFVAVVGGCASSSEPSAQQAPSTGAASPQDEATQDEATQDEATQDGTAEDGVVRYLAMGDSLTQGVGAADEQTGAFPALLAERWRADGCEVELDNVGISGYTAAQILDEQVPKIAEFTPTFITFQAGGNDIVNGVTVDEYRTTVGSILDAATASGARVAVLALNEWYRSPQGQTYGTDLEAQSDAFDAALIEEADARGVEFLDLRPLYTQQADDNQWVEDGLHPTEDAYAAWADEIAEQVAAPCA